MPLPRNPNILTPDADAARIELQRLAVATSKIEDPDHLITSLETGLGQVTRLIALARCNARVQAIKDATDFEIARGHYIVLKTMIRGRRVDDTDRTDGGLIKQYPRSQLLLRRTLLDGEQALQDTRIRISQEQRRKKPEQVVALDMDDAMAITGGNTSGLSPTRPDPLLQEFIDALPPTGPERMELISPAWQAMEENEASLRDVPEVQV